MGSKRSLNLSLFLFHCLWVLILGCGCVGGKKIYRSGDMKMKGKKSDENGGKEPNPHNPHNPYNPQRSSPPRNTRTRADTVDCARVTQNPQGAGRVSQNPPRPTSPRAQPYFSLLAKEREYNFFFSEKNKY
jgi:hypothetical protein